jgi:excisionase family DNA binding protein
MVAAEHYLKTRGVAQALGVSVSTIKRWVDSGMIQAVRTVGKHRLIPKSEALRVAREQGVQAANLEILAGLGSSRRVEIDERSRNLLFDFLREGKSRAAKALIHSVYSGGCGAAMLADELIRPVMVKIGHGWMIGSVDVFQEHEATQAVTAAVRELIDRASSEHEPGRPVALGATPEGDPYLLSTLLGELLLTELGYDVRNLGGNLPLRSLGSATLLYKPKLIFLSVNFLEEKERFVQEYLAFHKVAAASNAAVIVGGPALSPDLRARLVFASYGDRMAHLAEFATRLASHPVSRSAASDSQATADHGTI